jgi:hypothetical protein
MAEDHELERLRMQRIQALLKAKAEATQRANYKPPTLAEKIDRLMQVIIAPDALNYLNGIKARNMEVYNKIRQELFPPQITMEIDTLLQYLQRGMIRRNVIELLDIQYLERQMMGIGPTITIKKQGEDAKTLGSYLKADE